MSQSIISFIVLGTMFLFSYPCFGNEAGLRETISLDGTWQFATDPDNTGESQQWFATGAKMLQMPLKGYASQANGTIQVPGIWNLQGYGEETQSARHSFIGKGWYKRTVQIPAEWAGRKIFLKLGGISRYAQGWINGVALNNEILGYCCENEWDITSQANPGQKIDITICVDAKQRWEIDAMSGCNSFPEHECFVSPWGGIWGHVALESRASSYIDNVAIQTDYTTGQCVEKVNIVNTDGEKADELQIIVYDTQNNEVARSSEPIIEQTGPITNMTRDISITIPNVKLWTPETPVLYQFEVSLVRGKEIIDRVKTRTGVREFRIEGSRFLLNGQDIILRGYGDDHVYPVEFCMPLDKQMYLDRLSVIKSYGFNHVRHHSTIMPQEYYDACDELGMFSNGEFCIVSPDLLPEIGKYWKANVPDGTDPNPALDFYATCFGKIICQYRNHPSLIYWAGGNELSMHGGEPYQKLRTRYDFQELVRTLDPKRPFIDSDGNWANQAASGLDTQDFYLVQFDEWTSPIANGEKKFDIAPLPKPVMSHESANFCTFVRTDQYQLFDAFTMKDGTVRQSNVIPFWMTEGMKKMADLGLEEESPDWSDASEKLYFLHHKYNVEGMRLNPTIVGYHWWLFQDYWTTSNGLVDYFFRPKPGINREQVRQFNAETVVLQKGLPRTIRSGETMTISSFVSNFSRKELSGKQTATLAFAGREETKTITIPTCPSGSLTKTDTISFTVPELTEPTWAEFTINIESEEGSWKNSWNCRLFPEKTMPSTTRAIFSDRSDLLSKSWNILPLPQEGPSPKNAIYVVSELNASVKTALTQGAGVVLLENKDILPTCPVKYQQTWWQAGVSAEQNHCGTFVYDHPVIKGLTEGNWCDVGWYDLVQDSVKYLLESVPCRPDVIIRALPSILKVEDTALLFAVRVGQGTLVVSGLNHTAAMNRPENDWILSHMIDYAGSSDKLQPVWSLDFPVP